VPDRLVLLLTHLFSSITKLDVLTGHPEIKVCVGYEHNGKRLESFPASLEVLKDVKPVYQTFKGWNEDISKLRTRAQLPQTAQDYIAFVEKEMGISATWVGVGPGREGMVIQ
jgi:adenylosuccinate synthase